MMVITKDKAYYRKYRNHINKHNKNKNNNKEKAKLKMKKIIKRRMI